MIPATFWYPLLKNLNKLVSRFMYGVKPVLPPPLPPRGPALLVSDHSTLGDPLVLLASAGRPLQFLMAQEIYNRWGISWVFKAFQTIPVRRGERDIRAIRSMMKVLEKGDVVALFPEGGIDNFRNDDGHLGVAYLAVKTGAPVIPVSIYWKNERPLSILGTLLVPGKATVRYGNPLQFSRTTQTNRQELERVIGHIMNRIRELHGIDGEKERFFQNKSI